MTQQAPDCDMILIHDDNLARVDGIRKGIVSQMPYIIWMSLPYSWL